MRRGVGERIEVVQIATHVVEEARVIAGVQQHLAPGVGRGELQRRLLVVHVDLVDLAVPGLVADQVRGKKVDNALNILTFSPKKGAEIIKKVVESAIANAENNNGADIDELKVKTITVDKGMVFKRIRARAKGRAGRIIKPTCHIKVTVGS